jgi:uncharacterized protein (DUF2141 family)
MKTLFTLSTVLFLSLSIVSCKKKTFEPQPDSIENVDSVAVTSDSLSKLVINVSGMENTNGKLNVALYNNSDNFNNPELVYKELFLTLPGQSMTVIFDSIPAGTYAFALFHDENDNQVLDQNFLNIPQEGFAFSNNSMGTFGPPSYNQAKFNIPKNSTVTQNISLRFL